MSTRISGSFGRAGIRGQRDGERVVQLAARGERSGDAELRAWPLRVPLEGVLIRRFGLVEQRLAPQRVGEHRVGFGIVFGGRFERLRPRCERSGNGRAGWPLESCPSVHGVTTSGVPASSARWYAS